MTTRLLIIIGCHGNDEVPPCPFRETERTEGAGYAQDYFCTATSKIEKEKGRGKWKKKVHRMIDGYVEWQSEMRKDGDFPDFCPLYTNEMNLATQAKEKLT